MEPLGHGAIRFRHLGASTALSPSALAASAFSSCARSFIAARSSAVNPLDFLSPTGVFFAVFRVAFFALIRSLLFGCSRRCQVSQS
jgi:hypothetical protein